MINPKELCTDEWYYANKSYMSVSLWKKFNKCEVGGLEDWSSPTDAMLIGSYCDAYVEGTLDKFKENNPQIFSTRGNSKGELKADFKKAEEICRYIDNDEVLQQFLGGEKQQVFTGTIGGVPFKGKLDSYSKGIAINDLKVVRTVTDSFGNYMDFITRWQYDLQLSCYQELVFQNTGEKLPCYIVAITKENPINSVVVNIPQNRLDIALYQVESTIQRYWDIYNGKIEPAGCGVCNTCISKRKVTEIISLDDIISY